MKKPDGSKRPRPVWGKTRRGVKLPTGSEHQRKTRRVKKTPSGLLKDPSGCEAPDGVYNILFNNKIRYNIIILMCLMKDFKFISRIEPTDNLLPVQSCWLK